MSPKVIAEDMDFSQQEKPENEHFSIVINDEESKDNEEKLQKKPVFEFYSNEFYSSTDDYTRLIFFKLNEIKAFKDNSIQADFNNIPIEFSQTNKKMNIDLKYYFLDERLTFQFKITNFLREQSLLGLNSYANKNDNNKDTKEKFNLLDEDEMAETPDQDQDNNIFIDIVPNNENKNEENISSKNSSPSFINSKNKNVNKNNSNIFLDNLRGGNDTYNLLLNEAKVFDEEIEILDPMTSTNSNKKDNINMIRLDNFNNNNEGSNIKKFEIEDINKINYGNSNNHNSIHTLTNKGNNDLVINAKEVPSILTGRTRKPLKQGNYFNNYNYNYKNNTDKLNIDKTLQAQPNDMRSNKNLYKDHKDENNKDMMNIDSNISNFCHNYSNKHSDQDVKNINYLQINPAEQDKDLFDEVPSKNLIDKYLNDNEYQGESCAIEIDDLEYNPKKINSINKNLNDRNKDLSTIVESDTTSIHYTKKAEISNAAAKTQNINFDIAIENPKHMYVDLTNDLCEEPSQQIKYNFFEKNKNNSNNNNEHEAQANSDENISDMNNNKNNKTYFKRNKNNSPDLNLDLKLDRNNINILSNGNSNINNNNHNKADGNNILTKKKITGDEVFYEEYNINQLIRNHPIYENFGNAQLEKIYESKYNFMNKVVSNSIRFDFKFYNWNSKKKKFHNIESKHIDLKETTNANIKLADYEDMIFENEKYFISKILITSKKIAKRASEAYSGLYNEKNTCYLNSIFQILFNLKILRKTIFNILQDEGSPIFVMQQALYEMQSKKCEVRLVSFIRAMEWDERQQMDFSEMLLVLFDLLSEEECKILGTNQLQSYCMGSYKTCIKCHSVDHESKINDQFLFLSLDITNCKDLIECFEKFLSVEKMTEENKYEMEDKSKHDAIKTISIESLPPILFINLKRFEFTTTAAKKFDKITYQKYLDLNLYVSQLHSKANKSQNKQNLKDEKTKSSKVKDNYLYELFGIVVHDGNVEGGHYYTFFKENKTDQWIKFNDRVVTYATEDEVYEKNFGGIEKNIYVEDEGDIQEEYNGNTRTAYILIYLQSNKIDEILCDISDKDVLIFFYNFFNLITYRLYVYIFLCI